MNFCVLPSIEMRNYVVSTTRRTYPPYDPIPPRWTKLVNYEGSVASRHLEEWRQIYDQD